MKKIIEGKVYDTNTAEFLANKDNGYSLNDFNYANEELYLKKTGEYFLYGQGGGNSRYGEWHGNSGGPGEKIMPLTLDEAKQWAEENLSGEKYEELFGNPEPEDGRERLNLYVAATTKARLQQMSQEQGKSISQIIDDLVH